GRLGPVAGRVGPVKSERGTRNAEQPGEIGRRHDARVDVPRSDCRVPRSVIDSHVHFWDPAELHYPWLEAVPALDRAFRPADYAAATGAAPIAQVVFVEANCRPEEAGREVQLAERLARAEPRIAGIIAFADLTQGSGARDRGLEQTLDALASSPRVKGIR